MMSASALRSHAQVIRKIRQLGLEGEKAEKIFNELVKAGFISERRFALAFAGGKFRMKKWGRVMIEHQLRKQGIGSASIREGLGEIDAADYEHTLRDLLEKKLRQTAGDPPHIQRQKAARFAIGKGYEGELVWDMLDRLG
jgi:regulatory protein